MVSLTARTFHIDKPIMRPRLILWAYEPSPQWSIKSVTVSGQEAQEL